MRSGNEFARFYVLLKKHLAKEETEISEEKQEIEALINEIEALARLICGIVSGILGNNPPDMSTRLMARGKIED